MKNITIVAAMAAMIFSATNALAQANPVDAAKAAAAARAAVAGQTAVQGTKGAANAKAAADATQAGSATANALDLATQKGKNKGSASATSAFKQDVQEIANNVAGAESKLTSKRCTITDASDADKKSATESLTLGLAGSFCLERFNETNATQAAAVAHRAQAAGRRAYGRQDSVSSIKDINLRNDLLAITALAMAKSIATDLKVSVEEGMNRLAGTCENNCDVASKAVCGAISLARTKI